MRLSCNASSVLYCALLQAPADGSEGEIRSTSAQEKHKNHVHQQQDHDHSEYHHSLDIQGHSAVQHIVMVEAGGWKIWRCQSLLCKTVHASTMIE